MKPRFLLSGDTSLTLEFGNEISPAINSQVRALSVLLEQSHIPGVTEWVPTYRSIMIHYDPSIVRYGVLVAELQRILDSMDSVQLPPSMVLEIPVLYGGEAGPDLEFVAQNSGKTTEEVIALHSSTEYLIYMLGFTPGFTYLGGLDPSLTTPRLANPRVKIPAGSVGIAGAQTGVYPIDSPGGWQLIGLTPVRMYDPNRTVPILPKAGQYIQFHPIDQQEFDRIAALEETGGYTCPTHPRKEETA